MLKKLLSLAVLAVGLLASSARAQQPGQPPVLHPEHRSGFRCASDSAQQAEFARNPAAAQQYYSFLRSVAALSTTDRARLLAQPDVTIPVVVHVIHTGNDNNITDAQVLDAIRVLNEDFSKTNPDTADVIAAFQPIYANVGFRFRLAKRDPNGNCTTGITRTYSAQTAVGDNAMKNLIRWDPNRYLNIWVSDAANGAGGYAYYPCPSTALDGIVVRNRQFGSIGRSCASTTSSSANFCRRTLTHEVGHYFGLPHTWGNSNSVGLASNCGIDDGIADTPNTSGSNQNCDLNFAPCGVLANVQNYMDYATCTRMFTEGQKAVMRASLTRTCRATLVSAANLQATGTADGYVAPAGCAPVVTFVPTTTTTCEGGSVTFNDYSYNFDYDPATSQYNWSFPGGQPATSTARNPAVTYPTAGVYAAELTITTPNGSGTQTRQNVVQVQGTTSGETAPLAESFENPGFPQNFPATPLRNWQVASPGTALYSWERQAVAVPSAGTSYLQVRTPLLASNTVSTLTSPNINLTAVPTGAQLFFDRAYGIRTGIETDQLRVLSSTDCGTTWTLLSTYSAADLNTQGKQRFSSGYLPDSVSDWQTTTLALPAVVQGSPRFLLRFQLTSAGGNIFYLDNVRVGTSTATAAYAPSLAQHQISLAPNPVTQETTVRFSLAAPAPVQLQLFDVLGRPVYSVAERRYPAGQSALPLSAAAHLSPGVYVAQLTIGGQAYSLRLLVR